MNIAEKIKRVDNDLEKGFKKKAMDRLHGLIKSYPNELIFRRKLGQVYLDIGFKDNAGKYLVLEENRTKEMDEAVSIYLDSVNKSGWKILNDIQFQGEKESLSDFARQQLLFFEEWSKRETGKIPTFKKKTVEKSMGRNKASWDFGVFLMFAALAAILALVIIGLVTVLRWIF